VRCPLCASSDSKVVDSRAADEGTSIRRRRQCSSCAERFTTYERAEEALTVVLKQSGQREPFDCNKIKIGLIAASKGRPVSEADFDVLVAEVEEAVRTLGGEVTSQRIGVEVLGRLKSLDEVAYLRFVSVYRDFSAASDFQDAALLIKDEG